MNEFKFCAVVVWFNPSKVENLLENMNLYSTFVDKIFIVDNSEENNLSLSQKIKNSFYISLGKNTGIANALNVGCKKALSEEFEWCMTMDQDSAWNSEDLKKYISIIKEYKNRYENFSPTLKYYCVYSFSQNLKQFFRHRKQSIFFDFQFEDRWITSGSVMKLSVWENLGCFNQELFIDEVDFDYCARFSEKGLKNLCCENVFLDHNLGDQRKILFLKFGIHSDFRLFYQIRNSFYMQKRYPKYVKKYSSRYNAKKTLLKAIILNPLKFFSYLKIFKAAYADSKKLLGNEN